MAHTPVSSVQASGQVPTSSALQTGQHCDEEPSPPTSMFFPIPLPCSFPLREKRPQCVSLIHHPQLKCCISTLFSCNYLCRFFLLILSTQWPLPVQECYIFSVFLHGDIVVDIVGSREQLTRPGLKPKFLGFLVRHRQSPNHVKLYNTA